MATDLMTKLFDKVAKRLADTGVFAAVQVTDGALVCTAKDAESDASYRADHAETDGRVWVGLYTPDRWLSESIEADLMHVGDKIEELLEEELVDQGVDLVLPVEHFRDEQMRYVFRSPIELRADPDDPDAAVARLAGTVLAYEAAFRPLGDMSTGDDL